MGDTFLFIGMKSGISRIPHLRVFQYSDRFGPPRIIYRDKAVKRGQLRDDGRLTGSFPVNGLSITFNNPEMIITISDSFGKVRNISFNFNLEGHQPNKWYEKAKDALYQVRYLHPMIDIKEIGAGSMESKLNQANETGSDTIYDYNSPISPELMEIYIGRWNQVPLDKSVSDPFIDYTADKIFNKIPFFLKFLKSAFPIDTIKSNLYMKDLNLIEFSKNDTISSGFKYLHKVIDFPDNESEKMQFQAPFQDSQEVTINRTRDITVANLITTTRSKITQLYFNEDHNLCMIISITINSKVVAGIISANLEEEKLVIKRKFQLMDPNMLEVTDEISNFTEYPAVAVEKIRFYTKELHSSDGGSLYKNCRNATRKKRKTYKNVTKAKRTTYKKVTKAKRKTYKKRKNKKLIKKPKKPGKKPTNERKVPIK